MAPPRPLSRPAPAKLNLYLRVVGRRDDGYHLLDSLIAFAEAGDVLAAEPADDLSLVVRGPFGTGLDAGPDNLVLRAARALAGHAGVLPRARLTLDKRLPLAAGVGGGSADAAAALRLLADLWDLAPAPRDLARIGLALGADVPVCLAGVPAFVGGIGDRVRPAPGLPPAPVVLANPGVPVSTPEVFAAREGPFSAPEDPEPRQGAAWPHDAESLAAFLAARGNDLTAPACRIAPAVRAVLAALGGLDGALLARMSGSGGTCFALFADAAAAAAGAAGLARRHPGWWVAASRLAVAAGPVAAGEEFP